MVRRGIVLDTMGAEPVAAHGNEHDAVECDHKEARKPNPEILGNDTFSFELRNDPAP